uniref:Rrm3p n=1 Tax=Nothobranchius furzeri TaxID=105023 RepID=A0A1A8A5Q1_NOTFU
MPSDKQLPFTFTRHQFPIKPAFATTINESQDQTFDKLFWTRPVFSHGQLYAAESRAGGQEGVKVLAFNKEGTLMSIRDNMVYTDILQNWI